MKLSTKSKNLEILRSLNLKKSYIPNFISIKVKEWSENYEILKNVKSKLNNLSLNLLVKEKNAKIEWLKNEMEQSLGDSFSWSASQIQMIEVFGNLLRDIYFANGSIEINRNESGEWFFSFSNWKGPSMTLLGRGTISSDGNLKMNLVPGFKNKWADFLQVVNVLAAGNVRQGYRTLKRDPLEIEGSLDNLKLTNWWKLIGQGMGLEPHE